ncbi:MAG: hypothetical protein KBT33_04000 [Prevotellaceae bacterium]|nr:hypothetical protein [Candidatus Minthosoma equi]
MRYKFAILALLTAAMFTACSSDDSLDKDDENVRNVSVAVNDGTWVDGRNDGIGTRADLTDLDPLTTPQPQTIGVWGLYANDYGTPTSRKQGSAIPNDYYVYDESMGQTTNSSRYAFLNNFCMTLDENSISHMNPDTKQYHYTFGYDNPAVQSGSFPWNNTKYWFYCYAPFDENNSLKMSLMKDKSTVFDPSADTPGDPASIKYLKIENLPAVTATDITVARQHRTWSRLKKDGYANAYGACPDFTDDAHMLEHLYSAMRFCFGLDEKYAKIRYIHIKSAALSIGGDRATKYTLFKDVTNANSAMETTPVETYNDNTPVPVMTEWTSESEEKSFYIAKENDYTFKYKEFGHILFLQSKNHEDGNVNALRKFHLTVTYDVYDRDGQMTRRNAVAQNDFTFPANSLNGKCSATDGCKKQHTNQEKNSFLGGHYYNVYVKINPNYLYVLSDNDNEPPLTIR